MAEIKKILILSVGYQEVVLRIAASNAGNDFAAPVFKRSMAAEGEGPKEML